ncbi:hypothetical protein EQZ23_15750 [Sphingomonas sp. UV9]|uniref:hypothetical protein n=1 Tax=Sphingomonas sp. UV9 TaxID=1851410 RepID=UPI000FFB371D|nr:hypothetical protein [Sphingomonas sp. UV9]RXD03763.1 hypothetical protein EQZ23_15750 [Sphingomonas sp. UV9]
MDHFQSFVSAMVSTALVVALARLALSFLLSEPKNYISALCVGGGFLLGHYPIIGLPDDTDAVASLVRFTGSAVCLVIFGAGFFYQAKRTNAANHANGAS